jgi:hypothetical protein
MQHTLTHPVPSSAAEVHTEREAYIRELKRAYEAGGLANAISPKQVSERLISALFEETEAVNRTVH